MTENPITSGLTRITPDSLLHPPMPQRVTCRHDAFGGRVVPEKSLGDDSEYTPIVSVRGRVRTPDVEEILRLHYLQIYDTYLAYKPNRNRGRLLDADSVDGNANRGLKHVRMCGIVTDWRANETGRIRRICLMLPQAVRDGRFSGPADTHVWLNMDDLTAESNRNVNIRLGDMLFFTATLRSYRKHDGPRRIGVGQWTPTASELLYASLDADGRVERSMVARRLRHSLLLLSVTDGRVRLRTDPDMREELNGLWAAHPNVRQTVMLDGTGMNIKVGRVNEPADDSIRS